MGEWMYVLYKKILFFWWGGEGRGLRIRYSVHGWVKGTFW